MPERPSGFFIPGFSEGYFGVPQARAPEPGWVLEVAATWSGLATSQSTAAIRREFASDGEFPNVCLRQALHAHVADALHDELERGPFRRHHHGPYPLHVAPLESLEPGGALASFCEWLQSPEGTDYHRWLVGWTSPLRTRQVQVSRMRVGEFFPPHVDTHEEGLAVIYNFSRPWDPAHGGSLAFPHPQHPEHDRIMVPALFNSVFVFRTTGALHRVTPIAQEAEGRSRYSITAFMLAG